MHFRERLGFAALVALSTACGTSLEFKRSQGPLYSLKASAPSVAVVDINASNIDNNCGGDTGDVPNRVKSSIREYFREKQPAFEFADQTALGVKADFTATPAMDGIRPIIKVDAKLAAVPASVESPLVTAVYVMQYKCSTAGVGGEFTPHVEVKYAFSTFTKSGVLVATEVIDAEATGGDMGSAKINAEPRDTGRWESFANRVGRRSKTELMPKILSHLLDITTREAAAYHYFPFFSQTVEEKFGLRDDAPLKPGVDLAKAGKIDEALAAWEKIVAADAKSHGAYFNIAVAHVSKGDDEKAADAIAKAIAIEDSIKYRSLRDSVKGRLALRKSVE